MVVFHKNQSYTAHIPCVNAMEHKDYIGSKVVSSASRVPPPKFKPNKTVSLICTVLVLKESFCIICIWSEEKVSLVIIHIRL